MILTVIQNLIHGGFSGTVMDAEYEPHREELRSAGLREEDLRRMEPDDRVAALEQANLDPYDYIYLAC